MIPFVGPSYNLATRKASAQRSVNLYLSGMETPSKAQFVLQSIPGLEYIGTSGLPTRGTCFANGRLFVVMGATLYQVSQAGALTSRGTLNTNSGPVAMDYGISQLVIVDGPNGYVLTLSNNAFAQITDPDFEGADSIGYINGYFVLSKEGGQQFNVTAIDDATNLDALDFASSESSPDDLVKLLVSNNEILLLGEVTTERWYASGAADFPFSRDNAANSEVGCLAPGSARRIDNSFFWVGRDTNGAGYVFRDVNRQPQRISTLAVEQALQGSIDLAGAVAYTYQIGGSSFYCINATGVDSTWCYCVNTQSWFEACDLDAFGQFMPLRVTHTCYAYGIQWAFDADGNVYKMLTTVNTLAGDPLKRTRISPNDVTPLRDRKFYSEFALDCTTGEAEQGDNPIVELSWSDDGGATYGNPVQRSTGETGEYWARVVWHRLGTGRDRVWRVDFSDDAPFAIIDAVAR
jgi:hypothetical protein